MHGVISRKERLKRLARAVEALKIKQARRFQSKRGWYDSDGIRQGGLIAFVRYFWKVLEPETPFVDGWPLWAMCEHLEACAFNEITRLLINIPPGCMKSLLTDVFFPAWVWGPLNRPHARFLAFSYSASLTERDNARFRDLIESKSYQTLYGAAVRLRNKTITKVWNTATGWKLASSVGGVGTGERADFVLVDDPHNVKEAESEVVRAETVRWYRESLSSRFNNLDSGVLMTIMQRVHEDDVSGTILSEGLEYCHLMIPWEYESDRQFDDDGNVVYTDIGWIDPRFDEDSTESADGLPAWPDRFSDEAMARTKMEMGPYGWASQFQQSPSPRKGGIIERQWWQLWQGDKYPIFEYIIGSLDGAFTEKEQNDPSALTIWGIFMHPETRKRGVMLIDAWHKWLKVHGDPTPRKDYETVRIGDDEGMKARKEQMWKQRVSQEWGLVEWVAYTCRFRRVDRLLIESKASGLPVAQELQRLHGQEGWAIELCDPTRDKVSRALAVQPIFSQLKVWAPARDWAELTIDECAMFPNGRHDDLVDSTSQALKHLRDHGLLQTESEISAEEYERVRHKPKLTALYPV